MTRNPFGWSLPPGVTDRMIDEAAGAFDDGDEGQDRESYSDEQDRESYCEPEPEAAFWTVAIYDVALAYGGPEEGGWWYERGSRVDHVLEGVNPNDLLTVLTGEGTRLTAEQEAYAFADQLQNLLDATVNAGKRELHSVLSDGRYYARAYPGHPPAGFPATRPHYE